MMSAPAAHGRALDFGVLLVSTEMNTPDSRRKALDDWHYAIRFVIDSGGQRLLGKSTHRRCR